ncbi:MAG: Pr6Pr family membrane protein [Chitinophagaceae bacterium]
MKQTSPQAKMYATLFALAGWITLLLQLYIAIKDSTTGLATTLLQFFSFFTILTNIMVALSFTAVALSPRAGKLQWLTNTGPLTAVTVYIMMVCIIANTLLLGLLDLHGLAFMVDKMLHLILPLSMLLFWIIFVDKNGLSFSAALYWLWYPVLYVLYLIVLGAATGFYPYPFANAGKLGLPRALLNGVGITAAFALLSLLLIGSARLSRKKS